MPVPLADLPYHLSQIADLCASHPTARKILFVSSRQIGVGLSQALARAGHPVTNLGALEPEQFAAEVADPLLASQGKRPIVQDVLRLEFFEAASDLLTDERDGPFSDQTPSVGLLRALRQTVRALRVADVRPETLENAARGGAKGPFLARCLRAYESIISEHEWYDGADRFRAAIARLQQGGPVCRQLASTRIAVTDEAVFPGLARDLVESLIRLTRSPAARVGRTDYGMPAPAQSAVQRLEGLAPPVTIGRTNPPGKVLAAPTNASDLDHVQFWQADGPETEVRGVLRTVLRNEFPLDHVEIAYTSASHIPYLYEVTHRFDLPATFANGIPVTLVREGQAVHTFYEWLASGLDATHLIQMLRSRLIDLTSSVLGEGEHLEPWQLASLLRRARVRSGIRAYEEGLARLDRGALEHMRAVQSESSTGPAEEGEGIAIPEQLQIGRKVLERLISLVPREATCSLGSVARAGIEFIDLFVPFVGEGEAPARGSIRERLSQIAEAGDASGSLEILAAHLADTIAENSIEVHAPEHGKINIVPLSRCGYAGREHTYVLGLDETSFPGSPSEDPVLLDHEREGLSEGLELLRSRPSENVWQLVRALGASSGTLSLVASLRSLADGRESYPSPVWEQLRQARQVNSGDRIRIFPSGNEISLDETELLLNHRNGPLLAEHLERSHPGLLEGRCAFDMRSQPTIGRYNGILGASVGELSLSSAPTSVSRLESLTACPHRYFLRHILRLSPLDDEDGDPSKWLTPMEFGATLHRLFQRFMVALRDREERPDETRHRVLLRDLLKEEIQRVEDRIPRHSEAAFQSDIRRMERIADLFLASESTRDVDPFGFEVSFGFGDERGHSHPDVIPLDLGHGVSFGLRGLIDRIDREGNRYWIWDYKTGSTRAYDRQNLLNGGLTLQWALYAYALAEMLLAAGTAAEEISSGYYFVSDREHGDRIAELPPPPESVGALLRPLFELAEEGVFPRIQKLDLCGYCDFNQICADQRVLPKHELRLEPESSEAADILSKVNLWLNPS